MAVDIQGDRYRRVPKRLGDEVWSDAPRQMPSCSRISQIMESDPWQATFGQQDLERPSSCARVEVALTTKLTTERLDVLGRRSTIRCQNPAKQGQFRRGWTTLDSAPRAPQPQGAGAIPVPPALANHEFMGLQPHGVQPVFRVFDPILPQRQHSALCQQSHCPSPVQYRPSVVSCFSWIQPGEQVTPTT
jgi:hypothetical protein